MSKRTGKRILSALLCAAVLVGGALSASAAQISQPTRDTVFSSSQVPNPDDYVKFKVDAAVHSGQRRTKVWITLADGVTASGAVYTILDNGSVEFLEPIVFDGNQYVIENYGLATQLLRFDLYVYTPEFGSFKVERTVSSF